MADGMYMPDGSVRVTNVGSASGAAETVTILSTDAVIGPVTETAPASDTASSGLNGRLQRIAQRLTSLIALLPASIGVKLTATSLSTTVATDDAVLGATNETAPATDTATAGHNGRLQRIAQRLTTIIADIGDVADAAWTTGSGSSIALLKAIAGAAISTNPVQIFRSDSFLNITTKTTTTVKSGAGTLTRILLTPGTADTLTIYDNTAGSGTLIGTFTVAATANQSLEFGCAFATGLTIVSGGTTAGNYTVVYR